MKGTNPCIRLLVLATGLFYYGHVYSQQLYSEFTATETIFYDDFSEKTSTWLTGTFDEKCWSSDIKDGAFYIISKCDGYNPMLWTNSNSSFSINTSRDFMIETEIRYVEGESNNSLSVMWGKKGDNRFMFGISGNGYYKIYKYNGEWINSKDWTLMSSNNTSKYTRLTVIKSGSVYNYYINGELVHSQAFESFFDQQVGFQGNQNTTMMVNYLKIAYVKRNSGASQNKGVNALLQNLNSGSSPVPNAESPVKEPVKEEVQVAQNTLSREKTNEKYSLESEIERLQSTDPAERIYACVRIRDMKMEAVSAIPYLIKILGDDTPMQWSSGVLTTPGEEAAYALGYELGKPAFDQLIPVISDPDPLVRERAVWAVYEISLLSEIQSGQKSNPADVVALLIKTLEDGNKNVQLAAAWALQQINNNTAVEPLISILNNKSLSLRKYSPESLISNLGVYSDIRRFAARALGNIGDVKAVEPLMNIVNTDTSTLVRTAAAEALGTLKDVRAYNTLIKALQETNTQVSASAASALGLLGDVRAINPLVAVLKNNKVYHFSLEQGEVDHAARVALETLTGKDFEAICTEYGIEPNSTFENLKNVFDD
jgi:HEAT repeat protein